MSLNQDLSKIAAQFASTRVRFPTNNELIIMGMIRRYGDEAVTGNLVHGMTIANGRGVTFGQVAFPLKSLGSQGLVTVRKVKSSTSGRMVDLYSLTEGGETVYSIAAELSEVLHTAKMARKAPSKAVEPTEEEEATPTPRAAAKTVTGERSSRKAASAKRGTKRAVVPPKFLRRGKGRK